ALSVTSPSITIFASAGLVARMYSFSHDPSAIRAKNEARKNSDRFMALKREIVRNRRKNREQVNEARFFFRAIAYDVTIIVLLGASIDGEGMLLTVHVRY